MAFRIALALIFLAGCQKAEPPAKEVKAPSDGATQTADGTTGGGTTGDGTTGDGATGDGATGDGTTGDGTAGDGSTASVVKLVAQLGSDKPLDRVRAAEALGAMGKGALDAVPALAKAITDEDAQVRHAAITALRDIKPGPKVSVPLMVEVLSSAPPPLATSAVASLAEFGAEAVPFLQAALGKNNQSRFWASLVISAIGPDAAPTVPELLEAMKATADAPEIRHEVVLALGAIGPGAKDAVPALTEALSESEPAIVDAATYALGQIGPAAAAAMPKLTENMQAERDFLRTVSAWARAKVDPDNKDLVAEAMPVLVKGLEDPDEPHVRIVAARALVDLEPGEELIKPHAERIFEEGRPEVIDAILTAIAAVGKSAVPRLTKALTREGAEQYRARVASLLGEMGPDAAEAVPALAAALAESDAETKIAIIDALGDIGPESGPAVEALAVLVADEDEAVHHSAILALGKIGPAAKPAIAALIKVIEDNDDTHAALSGWAIAHIDPQAEGAAAVAVPPLVEALEHQEAFVRAEAAMALGAFGPSAASALDALKAAAGDEDPAVRDAAAAAAEKVGA